MSLLEARKRFAKRLAVRLRSEELMPAFCDHLASILRPHCQAAQADSILQDMPAGSNGSGSTSGDRRPDSGCRVIIDYQRADSRGHNTGLNGSSRRPTNCSRIYEENLKGQNRTGLQSVHQFELAGTIASADASPACPSLHL